MKKSMILFAALVTMAGLWVGCAKEEMEAPEAPMPTAATNEAPAEAPAAE